MNPAPARPDPVLLSGGNPQIAKGYGEAPIQAYIEATPGWKQAVVRRLDELVTAAVSDVAKAVKWNSPLYGRGDGTWFLSLHGFDRYVKVGFLNGADLEPPPPIASKQPRVRYLHLHEDEALDEAQLADWLRQASRLPGETM